MAERSAIIVAAILVLAPILLGAQSITALADDAEGYGAIGGEVFVKAVAPTVTLTLYSDSGYTTPTTEITPQTPVYMKIDVSGDTPLEEVHFQIDLYADNTSGGTSANLPATSPELHVTMTIDYDSTNNKWTLNLLTGTTPSTWSAEFDPNKNQPDPTSGSGTFYIILTFGKTAREAGNTGDNTVAGGWDFKVQVVAGTVDQATATYTFVDYTVYFYSEVTISDQKIGFGHITPNSQSTIKYVMDSAGNNNTASSFTVTVIANGYFDLKAASDPTWQNQDQDGKSISLVAGTPGPGEFSLQFDDQQDTNNPGKPLNPVYAVTSNQLASASPFVDNANPTKESGVTYNIYGLITLGDDIYTGLYTGNIYIYAVDGS